MIRFLLFVFFCLTSISAFARGDAPIFADLKWGASTASVRSQLAAKGFDTEIDSDGDVKFKGKLIGYSAVGWAVIVSNRLLKVQVNILTPDSKAKQAYSEMKEVLNGKYGSPTSKYEFFTKPYYEGDGYEEQALRLGKATFALFWGDALSMEITEKLTVQLTYESPEWSAESVRRKNRATQVF